MSLINYEFNLYLNWSKNFVIVVTNVVDKGGTLLITDAKLYVLVVTLSTQDNAKLSQQLKSGFNKRTISWNKYQSKLTIQVPNPYFDYLIDPSFQKVNRLFVL